MKEAHNLDMHTCFLLIHLQSFREELPPLGESPDMQCIGLKIEENLLGPLGVDTSTVSYCTMRRVDDCRKFSNNILGMDILTR